MFAFRLFSASKQSSTAEKINSETIESEAPNELNCEESNDATSQKEIESSDSDKPIDDERIANVSQGNSGCSFDQEFKQCMEVFHVIGSDKKKEKYVRCKVCIEFPNVVKLNCDNRRPPPMTTMAGSRNRQKYVSDHFQFKYHQACKAAKKASNETVQNPFKLYVDKADEQMISHVTQLLFEVYVDAKKLTSSVYSWPSRFVASESGRSFKYSDEKAPTIDPMLNLQYVNRMSHMELLTNIVNSDKSNFKEKIEKSIALSIRIDGSVDRMQIDKIYIMLKLLTANGQFILIFLGIGEQTTRGASGLFDAVKKALIENLGEELYAVLMVNISSICTDGTNMNIGERRGLWKLFEDEIRRLGSVLPFIKIWCSAHRMELAWGDVCKSHVIIENTLKSVSSISSHFHKSGLRTSALKTVAKEHNMNLTVLPKLFTIRWTEFSFDILNSVLRSWHALVTYLDINNDNDSTELGYLRFLTKFENLQVISFLADLLQIYSRFHKKIQRDKLTIVNLMQSIRALKNALFDLKQGALFGGWEETLKNEIEYGEYDELTLKSVKIGDDNHSRRPSKTDFDPLRNQIIDSIVNRLDERFQSDDLVCELIEPFEKFEKNASLGEIHEMFGPDLDLANLQLQYNEAIHQNIAIK